LGRTPLLIEGLEPGRVRYDIRLAGFKSLEVSGDVQPGGQTFLPARFVSRAGPVRGQPWENSLGMKFAPVGEVLVGVWPVRVQDFEAFCTSTARARPAVDFPQGAAHPVISVNWEDANAFCQWLTARERAAGQLEDGQLYRLISDREWSAAVGLPDERGETPEQRDGSSLDFPWGRQWPRARGISQTASRGADQASPATAMALRGPRRWAASPRIAPAFST
jgi:formylglycine-generating enzyme required for sulfatase activity